MSAVRSRLPTKRKAGLVVAAAVAVAAVGAYAFGVNPLATLVALLAGDLVLSGTIAIGAGVIGMAAAAAAEIVDATRKTIAKAFAAGSAVGAGVGAVGAGGVASATSTGPIIPSIGPVLPSGNIAVVAGSAIVALAIGNPLLIAVVGAAILFFFTDPLSDRGGFFQSMSFALKISTVALLAYLSVTEVGPALSAVIG